MNGVESTARTALMVGTVFGSGGPGSSSRADAAERRSDESLRQGPLASARKVVRDGLSTSGFIDVTGKILENFKVFLNLSPVTMDMDDLKPGLLSELASWVASEMMDNPRHAVKIQANVRPEAAVKLLT